MTPAPSTLGSSPALRPALKEHLVPSQAGHSRPVANGQKDNDELRALATESVSVLRSLKRFLLGRAE